MVSQLDILVVTIFIGIVSAALFYFAGDAIQSRAWLAYSLYFLGGLLLLPVIALNLFIASLAGYEALVNALEKHILGSKNWKIIEDKIKKECLSTLVFKENIDLRGEVSISRSLSDDILITCKTSGTFIDHPIEISAESHDHLKEKVRSITAKNLSSGQTWAIRKLSPNLPITVGKFSSSHQVMDAIMAP